MSSQKTEPPGPGFGSGHTCQYLTLAEGLRQVAEEMEADLAYLNKKGLTTSIASLRFEARCATITVLSAALCECMANTVLANILTPEKFDEAQKVKMPQKWSHKIPETLHCAPPAESVMQELWRLYKTRDAIVHPKATIFTDGSNVHIQGNDPQWSSLTPDVARKFVTLPLRVSASIPPTAGLVYDSIESSLRMCQPRLPCDRVDEVLTALELLPSVQRQRVRVALDRLDATEL